MALRDYMPIGWIEFSAWFENFTSQLTVLGTKYSVSAETLAACEADNDWVQYWIHAKTTARALEKQLTLYIDDVANGKMGKQALNDPTWSLGDAPPAAVPPGIKQRIRQIVRQIKAHPKYSSVDGELLGVIGANLSKTPLNQLQPKLQIRSMQNYKLVIKYRRDKMEAICIETRQKGGNWQMATVLTSSPGTISVTPLAPEEVEKIEVRARFQQKNQLVGNYSPIYSPIIEP